MKTSVIALSGFVAFAPANPILLNSNYDVVEGKPFELRFSGCTPSCSIALKTGPSGNLQTLQTLTDSATGASFTFTPSGLPSGKYAFEIKAGAEVNYSPQFDYVGKGSAPVSPTSASSTTVLSSPYPTSSASSSVSVTVPVTTTSASTAPYQTASKNTTTIAASNSTTSALTSATGTGALKTGASTPTRVPDSGVARLSSPMTLIAGAIAAMAYLS